MSLFEEIWHVIRFYHASWYNAIGCNGWSMTQVKTMKIQLLLEGSMGSLHISAILKQNWYNHCISPSKMQHKKSRSKIPKVSCHHMFPKKKVRVGFYLGDASDRVNTVCVKIFYIMVHNSLAFITSLRRLWLVPCNWDPRACQNWVLQYLEFKQESWGFINNKVSPHTSKHSSCNQWKLIYHCQETG